MRVKHIRAILSNQLKIDLLKMIRILTPKVFSQISNKDCVQFAIEAIGGKG